MLTTFNCGLFSGEICILTVYIVDAIHCYSCHVFFQGGNYMLTSSIIDTMALLRLPCFLLGWHLHADIINC